MPQLSLYIDNETLKKLETAAKIEKLSISKYAVKTLNEKLDNSWPENYQNLFGSVQDDTFTIDRQKNFASDSVREKL